MGVYSGNRTLLGESTSVSSDHILELALEAQRNDMNMFNAVIACDFTEAYNEAGLISLTEAEVSETKEKTKVGMIKKIKEFFKKIIEKIKTAVSNFIARIRNLIANDAKLLAKYKKYMNADSLKDITLSSYRPIKKEISHDSLKDELESIRSIVSIIDGCSNKEDIDEKLESMKKDSKEIYKLQGEDFDKAIFADKAEEDYEIGKHMDQVNIILSYVSNGKFAIDGINNVSKGIINELKKDQAAMKLDAKNSEDELEIAKLNAKYKLTGVLSTSCSKYISVMCNAYSRALAAARKAFVQAGSKAEKKANGVNHEDAVLEFCLGEASDAYVEAALVSL